MEVMHELNKLAYVCKSSLSDYALSYYMFVFISKIYNKLIMESLKCNSKKRYSNAKLFN